jgi:sigma-B regulation protein RsbU (phosphoserine phosphatase)
VNRRESSRHGNERLERTVDLVRDLSHLFDPAEMARQCLERLAKLAPASRLLLLTRRGFEGGRFGVAELASLAERTTVGGPEGLRAVDEGLLAELMADAAPLILDDFEVGSGDPGADFLEGQRSLAAIPIFERGDTVEKVVLASDRPHAFPEDLLAELTWEVNLQARAAFVADRIARLRRAYAKLDGDLAYLAGLQQALLPRTIPRIPGARVDVRYTPSERSGGDYYDFFALPEGRWGILLADVSGHGTATSVLMAITHAIAHLSRPFATPSAFLAFLDRQLATRYTAGTEAYVTACACVFDPAARTLAYSLAGHPAPRLEREGNVRVLAGTHGMGLGITAESRYATTKVRVRPGDVLVLYTDGVTEAPGEDRELFGEERLDALVAERNHGDGLADAIEDAVARFARGQPHQDDRTVLTIRFL